MQYKPKNSSCRVRSFYGMSFAENLLCEEREIKERERQIKIEKKRAMDQHELELKREEAITRIGKTLIFSLLSPYCLSFAT